MPRESVVAVVVAYNRRALLTQTLQALHTQSPAPDRVLVIDNASSDGTSALVESDFPEVELTRLSHNTGGAGGFSIGIERALAGEADWVWLMDDDTVPEPGALGELLAAAQQLPDSDLVASRVIWTNGQDHPMNTPRRRPGVKASTQAVAADAYPVRSASFVSTMIRADTVRAAGLPVADYFLWNDDFEFTARILRRRSGHLAHRSVVVHKTASFGGPELDPGPRFFLEVRNKLWLLTRSAALGPAERLLYSGSTIRRWITTFVRSKDRRVLVDGLMRGLRSGLRSGPRANVEVLAELDVGAELLAGQERIAASAQAARS